MKERIVKIPGQNIRDTTPQIRAAGVSCDNGYKVITAKDCIAQDPSLLMKRLPVAHRELEKPLPLQLREVHSKAVEMVHGIKEPLGFSAQESIVPPAKNSLIQKLEDDKEAKYHRKEFGELGKAKNHNLDLPEKTKGDDFKFGVQSLRGVEVKYIIHPELPDDDLNEQVRNLYIKSHHDYLPGQQKIYGHDAPRGQNDDKPVIKSDGKFAKEAMTWTTEEELKTRYVNDRLAKFLEMKRPQVGQVHDPLKETIQHLDTSHTFGVAIKQDEHKIPSLLNHGFTDTFKIGEKVNHTSFNAQQIKDTIKQNSYGSPSIRLKEIQEKKLSDTRTYINEINARALINPSPVRTYRRQLTDMIESKLEGVPESALAFIKKELEMEKKLF